MAGRRIECQLTASAVIRTFEFSAAPLWEDIVSGRIAQTPLLVLQGVLNYGDLPANFLLDLFNRSPLGQHGDHRLSGTNEIAWVGQVGKFGARRIGVPLGGDGIERCGYDAVVLGIHDYFADQLLGWMCELER